MVDSNISMEEDTELRDLVVQTLENNGVLAKVRAELRASVFLTLEEQESVLNPEPLLNKTVKQYLSNPEGKLLFCLVREFLEYFGLNYTVSVFDPETYFGKDYNYKDRHKLSEELGIDSKEPLLGEILKKTINSALNKKVENGDTTSNNANTTFDVSNPKILDTTSLSENTYNSNFEIPINVTITDKKINQTFIQNEINNAINAEVENKNIFQNKINQNAHNKHSSGNVLFFDEIITDGKKEKLDDEIELPKLNSDFPALNGKKANLNDLKELMEITDSFQHYDQDLTPPASASSNEQSPSKIQNSFPEEIYKEIPSSSSCLEKSMTSLNIGMLD